MAKTTRLPGKAKPVTVKKPGTGKASHNPAPKGSR